MSKLREITPSRLIKLLFAFFTAAFLIAAVILPDRASMLDGLKNIVTQTEKISTNSFAVGGYAGAFLNAGLVCLVLTGLFFLPKATVNATSVLAFLLTAGFTFWGINVLNLWFGFLGVLLYCFVARRPVGTQVHAMLFTTGLAPLISDLLLRYPGAEAVGFHWQGILLAVGAGLVTGFLLPAGLENAPRVHKGFDLYSAALPVGVTAFFLRAILYRVLGGTLPASPSSEQLSVASWSICGIFCLIVFGLCIGAALILGCKPRDYWMLLKDSGHSVDFTQTYGNAAFLMNVGVYGLFVLLYYSLIGAVFNAVTFGCIFCMLACSCSGSHPRNVLPIMVGYVAASFLFRLLFVGEAGAYAQAINVQAIIIGLCFASGLSPISGKYGWYFGVLAGALHFCLVTSVPDLHGGFCLYNGGFTAAFVCIILVPVLEHFFLPKEDRITARRAKRIKEELKS